LFSGRIVEASPQGDSEIVGSQVERGVMWHLHEVAIPIENECLADKAGADGRIIVKDSVPATDDVV
jgi:hypothetical protein